MTALNLNALREAAEAALNEDAVHGHVPPVIRAKLSAGYRDFLRGRLAEKCTPATLLKLIAIAEAAKDFCKPFEWPPSSQSVTEHMAALLRLKDLLASNGIE